MANTGFKGVDVRQTGAELVFRASLKDSSGAILATGTTSLYLFELQSDGTLKSYDFNDNTFKTTALTTASASMTHRTGNNATYNTGIWTYSLGTLTGFTVGAVYFVQVVNTGATPAAQEREFQYGSEQGDLVVVSSGTGTAWLQSTLSAILGTALTESVGGYLAAAFKKLFDVAAPVLTSASVNQTGDNYARLGAPAAASVSADIAAIKSDTGTISTNVATLLGRITSSLFSGITSLAQWLGAMAGKQTANTTAITEIQATGAGSGTFSAPNDSLQAIRDRGDAAWLTATDGSIIQSGAVAAVPTSTTVQLAAALGHANLAVGAKFRITSGPSAGDTRVVTAYADTPNPVITVDRPFAQTLTTSSHYALVYDDAPALNASLGITVATEYRCRFAAAMTSSAGTSVNFVAWLEDWNGNFIAQTAGATCSIVVIEALSLVTLFTLTPTLDADGRFSGAQANPNFTSDRVYSVQVTIVDASSVTHGPTQDALEVMG